MKSRLHAIYPIKPVAAVMVTTALLSILYLLGISVNEHALLNQSGPIVLGVVCLWAAYATVRQAPFSFLAPLPWFFLACGVYFGLGPLAYHYATPETVANMDRLFYVNEFSLLETNLLNSSAIAAICLTVILAGSLGWRLKTRGNALKADARQREIHRRAMWIFLAAGGGVKYTISLPYALGLTHWVVPGFIFHMDRLVLVALSLLIILVRRGEARYRTILYIVLATEIVTAVMTFSKTAVLMVAFAVIVGMYLSQARIRLLFAWGMGLVILYALVLSPFVSYARIAFRAGGAEDIHQGIQAVQSYVRGSDEGRASLGGTQGWWSRLCYTNAQAFVMQQYSDGLPGRSLSDVFWVFVPRALYADKPVFVQGQELSNLIQRQSNSKTFITAGVFAESFWNGGIPLVGAVCVYIGALFALVGRFTKQVLALRQYEYLPLLLAAMAWGYRIDGWFVTTYIGSLMEWLVLFWLLKIGFHGIGKHAPRRPNKLSKIERSHAV